MKSQIATFNDGNAIPLIGLGVMQIPDAEVPAAMRSAVELGYRSFDTAPLYRNELGVGRGVRESGLSRDQLFLTTKLWNEHQGYDEALRAFDRSIEAIGLDYIDLYLIHWPVPARDRYVESWRALVRLKEEKRIRSIGVSNFLEPHLERIIGETGVAPAINQIELHPSWQRKALRAVHARHGIVTEAWSPLGRGGALINPRVLAIAERLGCTAAQAILRWLTQAGIVAIPKASSVGHMRENLASLDLTLDGAAMAEFDSFDDPNGRFGPDPDTFETLADLVG